MPMGLPSNAVHHDDAADDRTRRDRFCSDAEPLSLSSTASGRDREPLEVTFVATEPSRSNDRDGNQHANHE